MKSKLIYIRLRVQEHKHEHEHYCESGCQEGCLLTGMSRHSKYRIVEAYNSK